jgi:hypothetical protein
MIIIGGILVLLRIYIYNKTSIKRNIVTIKKYIGKHVGLRTYQHSDINVRCRGGVDFAAIVKNKCRTMTISFGVLELLYRSLCQHIYFLPNVTHIWPASYTIFGNKEHDASYLRI